MQRFIKAARGGMGAGLTCLLALLPAIPLHAAEVGQHFSDVQAFVDSMPQGRAEIAKGYGDLVGAGRRDWAAVVFLQDPEMGSAQRIVVLVQEADGSYQVAAQGAIFPIYGGTGHHSLDAVRIKQGALFVSWSWNWHGCGGSSTQQVKFYKKQWRVIGAEFTRANAVETPNGYEGGDFARISHNLLTGSAVMRIKPVEGGGRAETIKATHAPVIELLDDSFDEDAGAVEEFSTYASC